MAQSSGIALRYNFWLILVLWSGGISMTTDNLGGSTNSDDRYDSERKHLESLLKDRMNFYLVFSSVFLLGAFRIEGSDSVARILALSAGTIVSLLIALAVVRTNRLVGRVLAQLSDGHPYQVVKRCMCFPPNANHLLIAVPFILTTLFALLTVREIVCFST
jgi:hypothetical protein